MKRAHLTSRRFQWVSGLLLAAETMMDMVSLETHQMDMSQIGEPHQLFENESQGVIRSDADAAASGHTMICCLEGEEPFSVANQVSLKPVKESGVSAQDERAFCENADALFSGENISPPGEITLLSSCQRE